MFKVVLALILMWTVTSYANPETEPGAPQVPPSQPAPPQTPPQPPSEPEPPKELVMNPTVYYKPVIQYDPERCEASDVSEMLSPEDKILVRMCTADFKNCLMQGSCYVHDEFGRFRSFNYFRRGADQLPRFKEVNLNKCPFGHGMRNVCLDPYYSVAADLTIYKLGDVIFVPKLVGEIMPDGEAHDGFLVVRDAGGAIKGATRFDFYTGFTTPYAKENTFHRLGFSNINNSFPFRMATAEEAQRTLDKTGYPSTKRTFQAPPRKKTIGPKEVLKFWFEDTKPQQWFTVDATLDETVRKQFGRVLESVARGEKSQWRETAEGRLAEVLMLSHFSRLIYRGLPQAYAFDSVALVLANEAIALQLDQKLTAAQKGFLYSPYMYSESMLIHETAVKLYSQRGLEEFLKLELAYKDIVDRFGRDPHRNAILGRPSTARETEYLNAPKP